MCSQLEGETLKKLKTSESFTWKTKGIESVSVTVIGLIQSEFKDHLDHFVRSAG